MEIKDVKILAMTFYGGPEPGELVKPDFYRDPIHDEGATSFLLYPGGSVDAEDLARSFDALLLSGSGSDVDPALYGQEKHPATNNYDRPADEYGIAAIKAFRDADKPIFSVCYGTQLINVAYGGTLVQDIPMGEKGLIHHVRGAHHDTQVLPDTLLARAIGAGWHMTNSSHHQAVDSVAPGFTVNALAEDGVIEGIEARNTIAVQWHPETMKRALTMGIFKKFVKAAALGSWEAALEP